MLLAGIGATIARGWLVLDELAVRAWITSLPDAELAKAIEASLAK